MFGNQGAKKKSSSLLAFLLQRLPYSLEALPKHSSFMCLVAHLTHCKHGHSVGFVLSNVNQTSKNAKSVYGMELCCALTPKIRMCMIYPQEDCVSYIRKSTISNKQGTVSPIAAPCRSPQVSEHTGFVSGVPSLLCNPLVGRFVALCSPCTWATDGMPHLWAKHAMIPQ